MNRYLMETTWSEEDKGFVATVLDQPGCIAWDRTLAGIYGTDYPQRDPRQSIQTQ